MTRDGLFLFVILLGFLMFTLPFIVMVGRCAVGDPVGCEYVR